MIKMTQCGDAKLRIKALTLSNSPITNMANGAGTVIENLTKNTFVTIINQTNDGGETYYVLEDHDGFIKKKYLKIIRDEEFFYSSSLLQSKKNRSSTSRYLLAKADIRNMVAANSPETKPTSGNQGTPLNNNKMSVANFPSSPDTSVIPANNPATQKQTQANVNANSSKGSQKLNFATGAGVLVAGAASAALSRNGNMSAGTKLALGAASNFMATGSIGSFGNTNIGGLFGSNSTVGNLLNGATINNLADGSFWSGNFLNNAANLIGGFLRTLSQKLQYVVGFDLYGALVNMYTGFGVNNQGGTGWSVGYDYTKDNRFTYKTNAALEARIAQYFKYKGANGAMITRTMAASAALGEGLEMRWQQDAYYNTGFMDTKKDENEVKVHQNLYENLYGDFRESLEAARTGVNLNIERKDWFYSFNRYRLIHPDSVLGNTKGYIFFTRPDLNIGNEITQTDIGALFFNMTSQHSEVVGNLIDEGDSRLSEHRLMPILSNRCTGIDIQDEQLETKEVNETLTGWKLNYAGNLIKSKSANSVTTSFIDDERLSIYLLFKLWCEYISAVSRGIVSPKSSNVRRRVLDYAISIHYFLTASDGESLIFWTKYTGCIPTNIPSSNFSDNYADPIKLPKYSINWQYAFKKDYDPFSLAEFNYLCRSNFQYVPVYSSELGRSGSTIVGCPYIDTNTAGELFKIKFRPRNF